MGKQVKMKLIIFVLNAISAISLPINSGLPKKLLSYQNKTGISDAEMLEIYENSLTGTYDNTFPKFRLTGTAPKGDFHPVQLKTELFKVDAKIRSGIFLCQKAGFYHFSAALSSANAGDIALEIFHTYEDEDEKEVTNSLIYASESQQKSANVELTLELELFDSIEIGKRYASANAANKNFFEGRMIP